MVWVDDQILIRIVNSQLKLKLIDAADNKKGGYY